jgi:hypothetical protein
VAAPGARQNHPGLFKLRFSRVEGVSRVKSRALRGRMLRSGGYLPGSQCSSDTMYVRSICGAPRTLFDLMKSRATRLRPVETRAEADQLVASRGFVRQRRPDGRRAAYTIGVILASCNRGGLRHVNRWRTTPPRASHNPWPWPLHQKIPFQLLISGRCAGRPQFSRNRPYAILCHH